MQQQLQLHTHKLPFQDINRIKNEHFLNPRLGLERNIEKCKKYIIFSTLVTSKLKGRIGVAYKITAIPVTFEYIKPP